MGEVDSVVDFFFTRRPVLQVLQSQVDALLQGEGSFRSTCRLTEEALAAEACVSSLQAEQQLAEQLAELNAVQLPHQPHENDQLDLVLETDGLRKSIHNLGTIVTTRWQCDSALCLCVGGLWRNLFEPCLFQGVLHPSAHVSHTNTTTVLVLVQLVTTTTRTTRYSY